MTTEQKIPKGLTSELYEEVKKIIVNGFNDGKDANVIKSEMFTAGVPFSAMLRVYRQITVELGLVKTQAEIRENCFDLLKKVDFSRIDDYESFKNVIESVKKEVPGSTDNRIISYIKSLMEGTGFEIPEKPKGRGKKTATIVTEVGKFFQENKEATLDEFVDFLKPLTSESGLKKWIALYEAFSTAVK